MQRSGRKNRIFQAKTGSILILIGFFFFATAGFLKGEREFAPASFSFEKGPDSIERVEEGDLPEKVVVSRINIDLPVFPGKVVNNQWVIAETGVSYLAGTGIPGRSGNVVIYGHNKKNLFGPIRWLQKDDQIKIVNRKKEAFVYKVTETKTVTPQEIEVLMPSEDPILTLYTCDGFLDKERFVVVAKLL